LQKEKNGMFFTEKRSGMLRMPDTGAGSGGTPDAGAQGNGTGETPPEPPTFETWYSGLDEQAKTVFDGHVNGLKTALVTERQNRADLAKQIKDLAAKAEKGSELERQLSEASTRLEAAERRASFAEDAIRPEIGCSNVKAAYALAVAEGLFDSKGRPDWAGLKSAAPELFRKPGPGSADGGAGVNHGPKLDMNSIIRRAAGRS
jgi:hypothetical protein